MATEDIKVENGHIVVDRIEGKQSVDIDASDVESVTFASSGGIDPEGDGNLVLHTKQGDVVIRVANNDAGEALAIVESARNPKAKPEEKVAPNKAASTK